MPGARPLPLFCERARSTEAFAGTWTGQVVSQDVREKTVTVTLILLNDQSAGTWRADACEQQVMLTRVRAGNVHVVLDQDHVVVRISGAESIKGDISRDARRALGTGEQLDQDRHAAIVCGWRRLRRSTESHQQQ